MSPNDPLPIFRPRRYFLPTRNSMADATSALTLADSSRLLHDELSGNIETQMSILSPTSQLTSISTRIMPKPTPRERKCRISSIFPAWIESKTALMHIRCQARSRAIVIRITGGRSYVISSAKRITEGFKNNRAHAATLGQVGPRQAADFLQLVMEC